MTINNKKRFIFDDNSLRVLNTVTALGGYSTDGDAVSAALRVLKAALIHNEAGFTELRFFNPRTKEEREISIKTLARTY